jgi:RimJ/RimL family protein N-acetyltransferase
MSDAPRVNELVGEYVRLEPLSTKHVEELVAAATENQTAYGWTVVPSTHATMLADQERGNIIAFAQMSVATGRAVGATRYLNLRRRPGAELPFAVEIGGTWLSGSAQRTPINSEAKLLLMTYAFEEWSAVRVDLKTDARNERSRNAMARIGATFEGVLRQWQPSQVAGEQSLYRDSAMFSVTATDWPDVRRSLQARLL